MDKLFLAVTAAALFAGALLTGQPGLAQSQHHDQTTAAQSDKQPPTMQRGMMGQGQGQGMMGQGMMGQGMMAPGMMQGGMMHNGGMGDPHAMHAMMHAHMMGGARGMMGQGTMGPGMMRHGMMGSGMMGQGMAGPGMMGSGMMGGSTMRVRPAVDTDDVSRFFRSYLERLGNDRLKLGKVAAADDDTITAEVVTVDDSLVQTFSVDRVTGKVSTGK